MSQSQHELEEPQQQQQQPSDITSLQENFSKQQKKISVLKELVRKSEVAHGKSTSSAQEKVKNIAQRLTNLKSKARSRQNLDSSTTSLNESQFQSQENLNLLQTQCSTTTDAGGGGGLYSIDTPQRASSFRIDTPGSEKILLLRKQMEENKVKMAEREHSKREIEHMVTQLKAKFDTTQQCLEHSSELGRSMGDLSALSYSSVGSKVRSATDLASQPFNLDKERIKFLDNRVRLLEKQLEKEKTSSDASKRVKELENKIQELEENLKEKRTLDLVANLNDHEVEESWQIENDRLKTELEEKSKRILHLEEINDILETAKCDLTEKTQELEAKLRESEMKSKKLEVELELLKSSVDSQKFEIIREAEVDSQVEQELLKQVHQLEDKVNELQQENNELREENENLQESNKDDNREDNTDSLEATVESQREDIMNHIERIRTLEEELMEKTIEMNVLNANFAVLEEKLKVPSRKPLFATLSDGEVTSLKDELHETKKTAKHLEHQLNEFKRMSDLHATVVELTEENEELQQRITELEDEKGQLLLKIESGEHTTIVTEIEIEKKIEYLEATCQNQTSAIQLLEEQKMDMTEDLESKKSELESARVVSEMESIQLEEQVNTNLQKIEELQKENVQLTKTVEELREEKTTLAKKMEHYVAENMELLDKVEKLSKSSSSAESIEIVERLTQQDRLEIEAFNKRVEQEEARLMAEGGLTTVNQQPMDPELTDNLLKLKEESSELMHRIELFTTERKEVLEKMEAITAENQEHLRKIDRLSVEKLELEKSNEEAILQKEALQKQVDHANVEKDTIRREIREVSAEKTKITAELNNMIKAASISMPSDGKDLLEKCEKSLAKLNVELENYRKANDKNAKFNASKKLSKEAKNTHQQLTELLQKIKSAPAQTSPIEDVAKISELQSEIDELQIKLSNATASSEEKNTQISRLNDEMASLKTMSEQFDKLVNDKEMAHEKQLESLTRLRRELEAKLETSDAEMKILQDLIAEQKQQLIEAYTDSENEIAKKIEELNERQQEVDNLKTELQSLKENSGQVSQQFSSDLQLEVEKLREALSINKSLLAEQIDDLTNKQETIETLNAQIMELYKTMEENADKVIEKEDEIALLQEELEANKIKIDLLTKENHEQNQVVDKLLLEIHSQKANLEKLTKSSMENDKLKEEFDTLEENLHISELKTSQLEKTVKDLEQKNKEQLDKLKKLAANLKKKVAQCQEFEAKIKNLEKGALDAEAQEKNPLIDELQNQLQEKTSQLEFKSHEIQALQEATNQQRKHFEGCVFKVQEALDGVQHEMTSLREQLHEKTTQVEELQAALNAAQSVSQDQTDFQSMKEQLRDHHNLINERNAKIDELNDIIQSAEPYHQELHTLRGQLQETNNRIAELNEHNFALQSQLNATLRDPITENINGLQNEIRGLQNLLNEKNDIIDQLNDQIKESEPSADIAREIQNLHSLLNEKNARISELNDQILQSQPVQYDDALRNLHNELNEKNAKIDELNDIIQEAEPYHEELQRLREQLHEKNTTLDELKAELASTQLQNDSNSQALSELTILREKLNAKEREIENQNKILDTTEEQLSSLQEELDEKNKQIKELNNQLCNVQVPSSQSSDEIKLKDAKIEELTKEFKAKSLKFEKSKAVIKEKNKEIQRLNQLLSKEVEEGNIVPTTAPNTLSAQPSPNTQQINAEINELRKENTTLREEAAAERSSFQETIARLETVHDGIQAKLQEDMSYIETLEQENNNFKEKICKLEECVAMFEERRSSMERRANLLDAQLQTRTHEHAKVEDELVYRLNMLSDHDDIIGQRLFEAQEENELLSNRLESLKTEHSTLATNYAKLDKEYTTFKEHTKANMEVENQSLKAQVASIDAEMKRVRGVFESQLAAKNSEIDELENDLSDQLRVINEEKRHLTEELEKTKDEINELKDERMRLNEAINSLEQAKSDLERESTWIKMQNENLSQDQFELQELRMQSIQEKTEIENLKHQIDSLVQNHEIELNALRTQIAELDSMRMQVGQNQTDDQVFIETENKRLTDLLAEKESLIENYQRQNLQLQMNALAARQQPVDPFNNLTQSDDGAQLANLREKCDRLERELNEKQREIDQMRMEQHQQVVVPPPLAFFGVDQAMPSVFDEIVAPRHVENLHGAAPSHRIMNTFATEEPADNQQTIEDLQRNVSDLEKHAQDLENKLAHRIAAHEESLRQLEELKRTFELRMHEYEGRIRDLEFRQDTKAIDCQIIPNEQAVPSLNQFFQSGPEQTPFEAIIIPQVSAEPVVEEMIVPKKAYDCQPHEELQLDDGWGWDSAEAVLEAKHFATTTSTTSGSLLAPQQQLELKLQEHQDRIQELELERDRLVEQKQEMQVKSGKLMKKLKEYKTKIDELYSQAAFRKSSSVESSDLDQAIQDEMKSQLKQLEQKLAEAKKITDAQTLEKENLLKRIDVLTAGNERMSEMKERQDNDVAMYKSRIRELSEKVKGLEEWSGTAPAPEAVVPTAPAGPNSNESYELQKSNQLLEKKIEELLSEIDDISGDRTELQALLDEEKANLQRAEQTVKSLNEKITRLENSAGSESADLKFQFNEIKIKNQNLTSQLNEAQETIAKEKTNRLEEIKLFEKQSEELSREISKLQMESANASELTAQLKQVSEEKHNLIQEIEALRMELTFTPKASSVADNLEQQIVRLSCDLDSVVMQNQDLGREVDRLREANQQLQQEINPSDGGLSSEVSKFQLEIQSLKQRNEELTAELDKFQLESTTSFSGGFVETEKLSSEINRLNIELKTALDKNEELSKEIEQLRQELTDKESLQSEITRLANENQSLTTQISRFKLETSSSNQVNELEEQIQEKDSEIMHLKQRIEDLLREDQTEKLVLEILTKNQEIHMLKMQVKNLEDDKHELDNNLALQLTQEMNSKKVDESADKIQQLTNELESMRIEKSHMEEELQVLNNHVMTSLENEEKMKDVILQLDAKNIEIAELRNSLSKVGIQRPPPDATQTTAQWEAVVEQRCAEIAEMWRAHLENREKEFKESEAKLNREIEALKASRMSASPQQSYSNSSSKDTTPDPEIIQKMQQALENQEVEIVTLKEQLAIRSAEYARLAAQFDPYKLQSTMSHSSGFSSDGQRAPTAVAAPPQVQKSELDLALYMLHQRDMRCEELTLELVNLLEERDTLQLKLSNTLRQMEAIKLQSGSEASLGDSSSPTESPEKPQVQPLISTTQPESDELNQKLSQLHSVSHSKRFQEERDMRQRQMEQLQQDIAKMPSEAISEIVGSDLSQSNQSPSSVLLNWLWGKPSGGQS